MKKLIVSLVLICLIGSCIGAQTYTPYEASEFPSWARDLRRSETIFFGAIPLAYPVVSLSCSLLGKDLGFWPTVGISASIALSIAITDFILGLINEK